MAEMNRKMKENREKGGAAFERKKTTRLIKGKQSKFNVARRPKRLKLTTAILTFVVFIGLFIVSFKVLQSYNSYEVNRTEIDWSETEQKDFDLFMSYGQYDLESGYYEGAKIEFEQALKIYPENEKALYGLKTSNQHLENYQQFD
jgi:tetratricopeptide (TPR) repeat protein